MLAPELDRCREVWPAVGRLIEERGWRGVGPSQFRFFYPRYMAETAGPVRTEAGSFVLDLWSEEGLLALLLFVAAMGLFFVVVFRWLRNPLAGGK